jgi:hypothetical protein
MKFTSRFFLIIFATLNLIACGATGPTSSSSSSSDNPLSDAISFMASEYTPVNKVTVAKKAKLYLVSKSKTVIPYTISGVSEFGEIDELIDTPLALVVRFKVEEGSTAGLNNSGITLNGNKCFGLFILKSNNSVYCTNHEISEVASNASGSIVYFSGQAYTNITAGADGVFKVTLPPSGDSLDITQTHAYTTGVSQSIEVNSDGDLMVSTDLAGTLKIYKTDGSTESLTGNNTRCFLSGIRGTSDSKNFYYADNSNNFIKLSKSGNNFISSNYISSFTNFDCMNPSQVARTTDTIYAVKSGMSSSIIELVKTSVSSGHSPSETSGGSNNLSYLLMSNNISYAMDSTNLQRFDTTTRTLTSITTGFTSHETIDLTTDGTAIISGIKNGNDTIAYLESGSTTPVVISSSVGTIKRIRGISTAP